MPTAHQQPQQKTPQKSAPTSSGSGGHSKTKASQLSLGSHATTTASTSGNSSQNPTDPAFPFDAEVTITSVFDKGDGNRSFDAQTEGGKAIKVWRPDEGDFSHLSLIQKGDTMKVSVLGHARKPGEWKSHLLPRDQQTRNIQNELRRREQRLETGSELRRSDIELPPAYADALRHVRIAVGDPDTKTYASRIVMAHLGPVVAALKCKEGK